MKLKKYRKGNRIDRWIQTAIIAMSIIIVGTWVYSQTITTLTIGRLQLGNNTTVTGGQVLVPNGSTAAPSYSFTNSPNSGIYSSSPGFINFVSGGFERVWISNTSNLILRNNTAFGWSSSDTGGVFDTILIRDNANTLAMQNGNADQTQRWYGANGSYFQVKTSSELLTIQNAASTDTAMDIPLNATVQGVTVYVVTVIPTAATFTVTGATSGTAFNTAAVGTGAGSNDTGNQNCPYKNGAAQKIRITPNLVPAAATGQVRIVLMYTIPSPPTS